MEHLLANGRQRSSKLVLCTARGAGEVRTSSSGGVREANGQSLPTRSRKSAFKADFRDPVPGQSRLRASGVIARSAASRIDAVALRLRQRVEVDSVKAPELLHDPVRSPTLVLAGERDRRRGDESEHGERDRDARARPQRGSFRVAGHVHELSRATRGFPARELLSTKGSLGARASKSQARAKSLRVGVNDLLVRATRRVSLATNVLSLATSFWSRAPVVGARPSSFVASARWLVRGGKSRRALAIGLLAHATNLLERTRWQNFSARPPAWMPVRHERRATVRSPSTPLCSLCPLWQKSRISPVSLRR